MPGTACRKYRNEDMIIFAKNGPVCVETSLAPSSTWARRFAINVFAKFKGFGDPSPADPRFGPIGGLFSGICGQRASLRR